jgi:hypothetical protein
MSNVERTFAVRDLVSDPDPLARGDAKDVSERIHQRAQAQLRRHHRTFRSEASVAARLQVRGQTVLAQGRLDGYRRTRSGISLCEIKPVQGPARQWVGRAELRGARRQLLLYADLASHVSSPPWGRGRVTQAELVLAGSDGSVARECLDLRNAPGCLERRISVCLGRVPDATAEETCRRLLESFVVRDRTTDRAEQSEALERLRQMRGALALLSMPPGSGKTRVAVRHSMRVASELGLPLYWITTKTLGREVVIEELERYWRGGVSLRVTWKTSARRTCHCVCPDTSCTVRAATEERLFWNGLPSDLGGDSWRVEDVLNVAREEDLCPHELLRAAEASADIVIADLNYVIGFSSLQRRRAVVVLDEAQNISRRVREYFQAALTLDDVATLRHRLTTSEAHECSRMLPSRQVTGDDEVLPERWLRLFEIALSRGALNETQSKFLAVLRLWERFPSDVVFAWYRGGSTPLLLGTPVHLDRIVESALAPYPVVLALSGSLPGDEDVRERLFPGARRSECIEICPRVRPPVFVCPSLDFRYPISIRDHEAATDLLRNVFASLGGTVLVFGQNRASNEIIALRLRVRGFTFLLDEDIGGKWDSLLASQPDFLLVSLSGSLAESVNPPPGVFSCAVVLSAGFAAPDPFAHLRDLHQPASEEGIGGNADVPPGAFAEAVSRIVQAVGRVQRGVKTAKPAFLVARAFANASFMQAWPEAWRADQDRELLCSGLSEALHKAARASHAN